MSDDYTELLGAYALDALEADEAVAVREHLETCARCANEVAEHHQVASLIASTGGEAPNHLWGSIAARLHTPDSPAEPEEPAAPNGGRVLRFPGSFFSRPIAIVAVAAAVVAIAALGIQVARLNNRLDQYTNASSRGAVQEATVAALMDPDARRVFLTSASRTMAELVVLPSGEAYAINDRLPGLPTTKTYQLWGQTSHGLISLGLLGNHPGDVAFHVDPGAITAFAVTAERAGGVEASAHSPVASGTA